MILQVEKQNDAIVQTLKIESPRLYEALRKADRINVPLQEIHGFGVSGTVFVGDNIFPPMCFDQKVRLYLTITAFITPPTGADFILDIRKRSHGNSILKARTIFPAGFTGVIERSEFGIDVMEKDDVLICDIKQIGSTVAGANMTNFMFFEALTEAPSKL